MKTLQGCRRDDSRKWLRYETIRLPDSPCVGGSGGRLSRSNLLSPPPETIVQPHGQITHTPTPTDKTRIEGVLGQIRQETETRARVQRGRQAQRASAAITPASPIQQATTVAGSPRAIPVREGRVTLLPKVRILLRLSQKRPRQTPHNPVTERRHKLKEESRIALRPMPRQDSSLACNRRQFGARYVSNNQPTLI